MIGLLDIQHSTDLGDSNFRLTVSVPQEVMRQINPADYHKVRAWVKEECEKLAAMWVKTQGAKDAGKADA